MSDIEIFSIAFAEGGVSIDYALSTDVRVDGKAMRMSTLQLSSDHPDYREDAMLLRVQALRMLRSALSDFEDSPPFVAAAAPDEDDDGMGQAPRRCDVVAGVCGNHTANNPDCVKYDGTPAERGPDGVKL